MTNHHQESNQEPFIPSELLPDIYHNFDNYSPLMPDASPEEIQRMAGDVIGQTTMKKLGLAHHWFPSEMWNKRLARSSEVIGTVTEEGESVILHLDHGTYYGLNRVGTFVWELLTGDYSLEDVLSAICNQFDVGEIDAREDFIGFIAMLRQKELIQENIDGQDKPSVNLLEKTAFSPDKSSAREIELYHEPLILPHGSLVELTNKSKEKDKDDKKDGDGKKDFGY
jgi:hypothetical protein